MSALGFVLAAVTPAPTDGESTAPTGDTRIRPSFPTEEGKSSQFGPGTTPSDILDSASVDISGVPFLADLLAFFAEKAWSIAIFVVVVAVVLVALFYLVLKVFRFRTTAVGGLILGMVILVLGVVFSIPISVWALRLIGL